LSGCLFFGGSGSSQQTPGTIVFGSGIHRVSAYQFIVKKPTSSFKDGHLMGWVAQLKQPVGLAPVSVVVINDGTKQQLYRGELVNVNPKWLQFAKSAPVDAFVKAGGSAAPIPGSYTLEYLQGNEIIAEGTFQIHK
jgi:hypothetical protein